MKGESIGESELEHRGRYFQLFSLELQEVGEWQWTVKAVEEIALGTQKRKW